MDKRQILVLCMYLFEHYLSLCGVFVSFFSVATVLIGESVLFYHYFSLPCSFL